MFNQLFNTFWDTTAKEDLVSKFRYKLIISTAKKLNCNIVLLNDSATDLVTDIVSNIILGGGFRTISKNYFLTKNNLGIKFLYPMQSFTRKEAITYLKFINYKDVWVSEIALSSHGNRSIQNITKKFILKLESNASLTTSTIYLLTEKLNFYEKDVLSSKFCTICHKILKTVIASHNTSTEFAKHFSEFISKNRVMYENYTKFDRHTIAKKDEYNFDTILSRIFFNDYFEYSNYAFQFKEKNLVENICYSCATLICKCDLININD